MKRLFNYLWILCAAIAIASCTGSNKKVVAVSQCSMDEWRDQMNEEMRREAFFHTNLDVEYHSTADNSEEQIRDIESFIERKVDLIVVAPNEEDALAPVIEKAYNAGIPVVMVDRKANTDKYTAYVGGDNLEVGRQAAQYIINKLPNGGNIVEIEGLASSSASQERKTGFHEVIDKHPEIHIVADLVADWKRDVARKAMEDLLNQTTKRPNDQTTKQPNDQTTCPPIDIVFAYNDRMAIGAHEAMKTKDCLFIGVDALMNDSIGVGRIEDGTLDATFLYPTGGDKAIHTAACILDGQTYQREQIMQTTIVAQANVHLMRLQADHIREQDVKIEFLNQKLDDFFKQYSAQRILLYTITLFIIIVFALLLYNFRAYRTKHKLNIKLEAANKELAEQKEMLELQRDQLEAERDKLLEQTLAPTIPIHVEEAKQNVYAPQSSEAITSEDESVAPATSTAVTLDKATNEAASGVAGTTTDGTAGTATGAAQELPSEYSPFLERLMQVIEKNLYKSELTVDMLGAEVNLGRVQLYRKCKAASGMSPNELLRTARLNKAYQLLRDTDMNVSEVAYAVGFSSPSYFTKCYKDHFGTNPSGK